MRILSWGFTISCILSFAGICVAQSQCFVPNGQAAAGNFPCDPTATHSACCDTGSTCLTNKLCRGPNGNIIRGTCTDKNWESPECAYYCMSATRGGHDLISCQNVTNTDTSFCCDGHRAFCCDDGVARFNVLPSNPQTWATFNRDSSQFVVINALKTATPSSSSSASSATTALSTTLSTLSTSSSTSTDPVSSAPTPSSTSDPDDVQQAEPSESSEPFSLPIGAQAGIGAGAGVLVIALGAVGFLVWKLRRNKRAIAEKEQHNNNAAMPVYHHQYGDKGPHHPAELGAPGQGLGVHMPTPRYELDQYAHHTHAFGGRVELPATPR